MNRAAVFHIPDYVYAYPVAKDSIRLRLLAARGDLKEVRVRYRNLYEHIRPMESVRMDIILSDDERDVFEATITVPERRFRYYFELIGDENACCTSDGILSDAAEANCFFFPYTNEDEVFSAPGWAQGAIIYQLLVDRFYNGSTENDPPGCKSIDEPPDRNTYYGGDFQGILEKLDYLSALGVSVIYLSPVFLSPTYHKYDTTDYYSVESTYGGEEKLKELVDAAHARGIAVILDGVFNHSSDRHPFFMDLRENGKNSKYADWYCVTDFADDGGFRYDSFGGLVPEMPRWNTSNPDVANYLTQAACYWTKKLSLDGWRLDVADEIPHGFWKKFKRELQKIKPDIFLIGEIWNYATGWLLGDELDSATNYKYRNAMLALANGSIDCGRFWRKIGANLRLYKTPQWPYLINLLGSHDTARLHNEVKDRRLASLALLCTLCFEGMPLIYYGDEAGLEGGDDPDNRGAMRWVPHPMIGEVEALGSLRRDSEVLRRGSTVPVEADGLLCFERKYADETVRVTANFTEDERFIARSGSLLFSRYTEAADGRLILKTGGLLLERRSKKGGSGNV